MRKTIKLFFIVASIAMTACNVSQNSTNINVSSTSGVAPTATATIENKLVENTVDSQSKILWDFRKTEDTKAPTFSKKETAAVIKYLFGDQADPSLKIRNRFAGSFTNSYDKQTLYYLSGCKDEESGQFTTDCPHVSWDTVGWIAIFEDSKPIMKISEPLGFSMAETTDVNHDGKNEILSFSGYGQSGIQTQGMSVGQIVGDKFINIARFDGYADNCAFDPTDSDDKKSVKAAVISYVPTIAHVWPEFTGEFFQGKCKGDSVDNYSWKKITKKEFDTFFNSLS